MPGRKKNGGGFFPAERKLLDATADWAWSRMADPFAHVLGGTEPLELPPSVTPGGLGGEEAMRRFREVVAPTLRPSGHPMNFAFVGSSPTPAAVAFDLVSSAAATAAGSFGSAGGAVQAENQALRWLIELAGLPAATAGGTFVSGGTVGNLSALHAARHFAAWKRREAGVAPPARWKLAASDNAHSSIVMAARVMDVELCAAEGDPAGRLTAAGLEELLKRDQSGGEDFFAVAATAGATSNSAVDNLAALAEVCKRRKLWLHVDGAYGLAAMASPMARPMFDGVGRADSFIVDPHKMLFAPYDCCALVYRDAARGRAASMQTAPYLTYDRSQWNPAEYAVHLSRRPRGMAFWFSLAVYGTDKYAEAVQAVLDCAAEVADGIEAAEFLELTMRPDLSILLFTRPGMSPDEMRAWCDARWRAGDLFCQPTIWRGGHVFRLCMVNPNTRAGDVLRALETLR